VFLLVIAAWAWWTASRRGLQPWRTIIRSRSFLPAGARPGGTRIVESIRLDVGGRVHVIEWRDEHILVAVNGAGPAVVLARRDVASTGTGNAP
jgi:hypothetical protein